MSQNYGAANSPQSSTECTMMTSHEKPPRLALQMPRPELCRLLAKACILPEGLSSKLFTPPAVEYMNVEEPTARRTRTGPLEPYKCILTYDDILRRYLVLWEDNGTSWIAYDQFDPPPSNYDFRKEKKLELKVGYTIFWWRPGRGCNEETAKFRAKIRRILPVEEMLLFDSPLETDCLEVPSWHDQIQVLSPYLTPKLYYLRDFDLHTGVAPEVLSIGQKMQKECNQFRQTLKRKHPSWENFIQGDNGR